MRCREDVSIVQPSGASAPSATSDNVSPRPLSLAQRQAYKAIMKAAVILAIVTVSLSVLARDITFTNKTASFTNLQGQIYNRVQLIRGDLDGLIWRDEA